MHASLMLSVVLARETTLRVTGSMSVVAMDRTGPAKKPHRRAK